MTDAEKVELAVLRKLRAEVKRVFTFSGWEDGVDEDAADAIRGLQRMSDHIDDVEELLFPSPRTPSGCQEQR